MTVRHDMGRRHWRCPIVCCRRHGAEGINRKASRPAVSVGRLVTEIGNMAFDETLYAAAPVWMQNVLMNVHGMRIHRHRYGRAYQRLLNQFATTPASASVT